MNQFKPYPEYKDSGVKWLGDVPRHWEVHKIRNIVNLIVSNVDKHSFENEQRVNLCNYTDVYKNEKITNKIKFMKATASKDEIKKFKLQIDDVVITKDSESWNDIGVPALIKYESPDFICGYHLAILRSKKVLSGSYLFRLLQDKNTSAQFHVVANGVTRYGMSQNAIKDIKILLPDYSEQTQIARFLDFKTAQIAKFIKSKKRMIELLKEQKQAIINDAVTGKIDVMTGKPYPKYKDSGVKWLGQVPEGWEVKRLKNIALVKPSGVDKKSFDNELPVLLCNYVDVYKNNKINSSINFMKATATKEEIKNYSLLIGDIVITKDSETWKDIAVPAIVTENIKVVCAYHLAIIRIISNKMISPFLFYALYSDSVAIHFRISANGVTRFGLSQGAIKSAIIPIPSIDEQSRIVKYIEMSTTSINNTIERIEREISLMQEFRSRLISDVVTGKIDVRGIEVPEVSEEPSAVDDLNTLDSDESSENEVLDEKVDD